MEARSKPNARWLAVVVLAAAIAIAFAVWRVAQTESGGAKTLGQTDGSNAVPSEPEVALAPIDAPPARVVEPERNSVAAARGELHGFVVDLDGERRASVGIVQRIATKEVLIAHTGADGAFTAVLEKLTGDLATERGTWPTVVPCKLSPARAASDLAIVVAPPMDVRGRVVDARGHTVATATVAVRLLEEGASRLPKTLDRPPSFLAQTSTDAAGEFALLGLPSVPGSRLAVSCDPLKPQGQPMPASSTDSIVVVLQDPTDGIFVEGVVLQPDTSIARGATVCIGGKGIPIAVNQTGLPDGRFRVWFAEDEVRDLGAGTPLFAHLAGFQSVFIPEFGRAILNAHGNLLDQVIQLVGPELKITGTVVRSDGKPVGRAWVEIVDRASMQGCWSRGELEHSCTASDARVELCDLLPRDYVLECTVDEPRVRFFSEPIPAGTRDVVLRIPADAIVARLAGRVVDRTGAPFAEATVSVVFPRREDDGLGVWVGGDLSYRDGALTGDDGAFELHGVGLHDGSLLVRGEGIVPQAIALDGVDPKVEMHVVVQRFGRLRFDGFTEDFGPVSIELRDAQGKFAPSGFFFPAKGESPSAEHIDPAHSKEMPYGEGHYRLTLERDDKELFRRDVDIVAGETLVVKP